MGVHNYRGHVYMSSLASLKSHWSSCGKTGKKLNTTPVPLGTKEGAFCTYLANKTNRAYARLEGVCPVAWSETTKYPRLTHFTRTHTHTHTQFFHNVVILFHFWCFISMSCRLQGRHWNCKEIVLLDFLLSSFFKIFFWVNVVFFEWFYYCVCKCYCITLISMGSEVWWFIFDFY